MKFAARQPLDPPRELPRTTQSKLLQSARRRAHILGGEGAGERHRPPAMACSASAGASLLASSLSTKSIASLSSSSSVYYPSLGAGSSAFFRDGDGAKLWGSRATVRLVSRRVGGPSPSSSSGALGCRCIFGLGVPELVVIAGVAALVFGPKKLPEIGRSIGKTVKSFQQAAKEFETELKKEPEESAESPAGEMPKSVSGEEKKELEASGTKEST